MLELPFEPPIQKIDEQLFHEKGIEVHLKREDLIHPFISGNKWRKLKYVLADAQEKNKDHLVSFGGAYSNHLVALACAGAMYGFKTTAFVRGEPTRNPMLMLCDTWGMQLHFVSREDYRDKTRLCSQHIKDPGAYLIDEGGRGKLAMQGCTGILDKADKDFTHVICAVGTGTTLAGLALSAAERNMIAEGICVLKNAQGIDEEIETMVPGLSNWKVHHRFYRGGYAKTDEELMQFIRKFARTTSILLDQVYTAKMMMGVMDLVKADHYQPGSKLLLIHTGGLLGLLSQY